MRYIFYNRAKLKQRVAKMINDGFFVQEEYKTEIKVGFYILRILLT